MYDFFANQKKNEMRVIKYSFAKQQANNKRTTSKQQSNDKRTNQRITQILFYQTMVTTTECLKSEFLRVHTAGAVYCITDMILFDVLQKIGDQYYLHMCIQIDEFDEKNFLFRWDEIPKDVSDIYEYVKSTSIIEATPNGSYTLYGDHIARRNSHKYTLINFPNDPFKIIKLDVEHCELDDENTKFIAEIAENMRIVKVL